MTTCESFVFVYFTEMISNQYAVAMREAQGVDTETVWVHICVSAVFTYTDLTL